MADGKKVYSIEIQGLKTSIDAVDALTKQLDALEKKINELNSKGISVKSQSNVGALKEEDALLKQIEQTQKRINEAKQDEYKQLLHAKAELKEYQTIAKSAVSSDALTQGLNDTSTMQGMKAQLKDIKQAMQTIDVESDKFKQLQQEANELNNKLKEIEQGYGQFGRNVGNYANGVAEGMQQVVIKVGETERTFTSAKEAARTLGNELKNMAVNGQQGTKEYKDLDEAVKQLDSTLKDVKTSSVAMDELLDTMQGLVAIASTAKGISALFGLDNDAIEESIQKLVALQNVLNGIETIRKQMQTQEGIGLLLTKGNQAIDNMAASLLKVDKAAAASSKSVKALSTALKGLGGVVIAAAIIAISAALDKLKKKFDEVKNAAEQNAKYVEAGAEAYVKAKLEVDRLTQKINNFNGKAKEEKKLVNEVNTTLGTHFKSLSEIRKNKDILIKQSELYCETLKQEAIAAATAAEYARLYAQVQGNLSRINDLRGSMKEGFFNFGNFNIRREITRLENENKQLNKQLDATGELLDTTTKKAADLRKKLGTGTEVKEVKSNGKNTEDAVKKAQDNINELKLRLMKEGLAKQLMELDIANKKEIEKIKQNGKRVEEQLKLQEKNYQKERARIIAEYSKNTKEIESDNRKNAIENEITSVDILIETYQKLGYIMNKATSASEKILSPMGSIIKGTFGKDTISEQDVAKLKSYIELYTIRNDNWGAGIIEPYFEALKKEYLPNAAKDIQEEFAKLMEKGDREGAYNFLFKNFELETLKIKEWIVDYGDNFSVINDQLKQSLLQSYDYQERIINERYTKTLEDLKGYFNKRKELVISGINDEWKAETDTIQRNLNEVQDAFETQLKLSESTMDFGEAVNYYRDLMKANKDTYSSLEQQMIAYVRRMDALDNQLTETDAKYQNQIKKVNQDTLNDMQNANQKYYDEEFKAFDRYISKVNELMQLQPKRNATTGFINIKQTRADYNEALELYKTFLVNLDATRHQAFMEVNNKDISAEQFQSIIDNIAVYEKQIKSASAEIKKDLEELTVELLNDINFWIQQVGQAATSIIQSIGEINDAAFEKQMEALEKQTELLEKQLDKQKELTEQYADDVDSIEDELSTARGDRRQHLIDQLNAQMQAQRESLAQEKQIEKEQERMEAKKKKLEDDDNRRKKKQAITTALINAALAISNAAVNKYPIPAIPMIAMATAVGAAQVAAVKAQKYADGGVINGKSHARGGVKVFGGQVELEGNEFVTNKKTTAENTDLLYYINSKKRRIDLSDMIEFYSSAPKKSVRNVKMKFEDGGQIPTLRDDITLNNRLIDTMEHYANRPNVVQVVDIMDKTEEVNRVQVLAGLK